MRTFAVAIAVLSILAGMPTAVALPDECATAQATQGNVCVPIPVQPTSPVTGVGIPPTVYWDTYYLWLGAGHCTNPANYNDCASVPHGSGSGIPLPDGSTVAPPPVISVLFRETNGVQGLQRSQATAGGRQPDATVLL